MRRRSVLLGLVGCLVLASCQVDGGAPDDAGAEDAPLLHVVATTSIIGDVVAQLVGDEARLDVLMDPGVDPHQFQASAAQGRLVQEADLVVANGLGLEESLVDLIAAAEAEGVAVFRLTDHVEVIDFALAGGHVHRDDDDHGHDGAHDDDGRDREGGEGVEDDHGTEDPHVWQDPVRVSEAVLALGQHLGDLEPTGGWPERAEAYADELQRLHDDIEGVLGQIPDDQRKLITSHDSLGYLADRYDLDVIGAIIPGGATLGDPSGRQFQQLAQLIEREQVHAIFAEVTQPTRLAEALAREVGRDIAVVVLFTDALGADDSGAETYVTMMRTNAQRIADALGG